MEKIIPEKKCLFLILPVTFFVFFLPSFSYAQTVTITSPVPYQVFQRDGSDQADIPISGTYTGSPAAIEARFNGGSWTTIDASPSGGAFTGTTTNQTAGQGTLEVRFTDDTDTSNSTTTIGIGDIFVIAGQSNGVGKGDNNQSYSHSTLAASLFGNDDNWKELTDPTDDSTNQVDSVSDDSTFPGGSVWPLVATRFLADQGVPVAFIPAAKSGSFISGWAQNSATTTLYGSMQRRINTAGGVGGVKAVIFWQGESDSAFQAASTAYNTSLDALVSAINSDFGVKTVVVGMVSASATDEAKNAIREAQVDAWNDNSNVVPGGSLYDLATPDGSHISTNEDLQTAANRIWAALEGEYYSGSDDGRGPRFVSAEENGTRDTITLTFTDDTGPILPGSGSGGFYVTDNGIPKTVSSVATVGTTQLELNLAEAATGILAVSMGYGDDSQGETVPTDSSTYSLPIEPFFNATTTNSTKVECSWVGGNADWADSTSNWSCGAIPNDNTYDVTLCDDTVTSTTTVTVTSAVTVGRLTIGKPHGSFISSCGGQITTILDLNASLTVDDEQGFVGAGDLVIGTFGELDANDETITIDSSFLRYAALSSWGAPIFTPDTSTVKLIGDGRIDYGPSDGTDLTFYNLEIATSTKETQLRGGDSNSFYVTNIFFPGSGTITEHKDFTNTEIYLNAGTMNTSNSTVLMANTDFYYAVPTVVTSLNVLGGLFEDYTLFGNNSGAASNVLSLTGSTTIGGNFLIRSGLVKTLDLDTNGNDLTIEGNAQLGAASFYDGDIVLSGDSTVTINGNVTEAHLFPTTGIIRILNGNTLNLGGNFTFDTADSFFVGTGTVAFTGSTDQTIEINDSFYNLTLNNTGASGSNDVIFSNNVDVDNNLTITDGDLDIDTNNVTLTVGEDITIGSGGSYTRNGEAFTIDGTTTFTDNSGAFDLGDLTVASTTAAASLTLGSNATSSGLTIASGETLSLGSNNLFLTDATASSTPLTVNGTFTPGTGTVTYKATSTQTTIPVLQYYNLALDGGASFLTSAVTTVLNSFTNLGGYLNESTGYISASSTTSLNQDGYTTSDSPTITVLDGDANTSATSTDSFTITASLSNGDTETVTLTETGNATGIFTGSPSINTGSVSGSDGALNVPSGSTILTATFTDTKESTDTTSDTATITNTGGTTNTTTSTGAVASLPPSFSGGTRKQTTTPTQPQTPSQPSQPSTGSGLTSAQVTSIITLLTSFNVDQTTLDTVRNILQGNTSPTGNQTFTVSTTNLTGPFRFNTTSSQTRLLQQILAQDTTIYPEGLTTGYYGTLTRRAVGKFQERHNLAIPTDAFYGYAGPMTRAKIKEVY
ncbi:hypothetical protein CL654_02150 [bacterium]|nr:hypothetical protein [bacterium]|tara:strand:- start:11620 stop:15639 length:4020 start_codon:yes stop_codon:yes gene_type:complete